MKFKAEYLLYGLIIIMLFSWTVQRNQVWQSDIALWEDCVEKSPNKTRPYNNLGTAYILNGEYAKAKNQYVKAIKIDDKDYVLYYNLAIAYYHLRDLVHAYPPARKAALMHKDTMTLYQLGITLRDMGWKVGMENPKEEQ
jgi:tetratricopeptide (TPR) repeat protein